MPGLTEYKCPACGGAMEYDSISGKMKCPYCDTMLSVEEYNATKKDTAAETGTPETAETIKPNSDEAQYWQDSETAGMMVYSCESCGGEIIGDETLGATTCPYCGNNIVMKGQFKGDLKPDYIIPFKKDKKMAKEAYYKHLEKKPFLPKVFRDENHIDEIKGIYVPFWIYDAEVGGTVEFEATRVHTRKVETSTTVTTYTTTDYYRLDRKGWANFKHVPADGSSKMDDALMDSIEPYNFEELIPFEPAYMAGYLAERYDVSSEECLKRAEARMRSTTVGAFHNTTGGYNTATPVQKEIQMRNLKTKYALLPVWILNTTWNGQNFIFAMNGQNGNLVGDLPCDNGAYWRYAITRGLIIGAFVFAGMMMLLR